MLFNKVIRAGINWTGIKLVFTPYPERIETFDSDLRSEIQATRVLGYDILHRNGEQTVKAVLSETSISHKYKVRCSPDTIRYSYHHLSGDEESINVPVLVSHKIDRIILSALYNSNIKSPISYTIEKNHHAIK